MSKVYVLWFSGNEGEGFVGIWSNLKDAETEQIQRNLSSPNSYSIKEYEVKGSNELIEYDPPRISDTPQNTYKKLHKLYKATYNAYKEIKNG